MIVPGRYNGPPESANGGYACGLVAGLLGGVVEVTLRLPPPLDRELEVVRTTGASRSATARLLSPRRRPVELDVDVPAPVSVEEAADASTRYEGFVHHAYNTCFVCGPRGRTGCASTPARSRAGRPARRPLDARRGRRPELVWARSTARAAGPWTTSSARRPPRSGWRRDRPPAGAGRAARRPRLAHRRGRAQALAGSALLTADGEVLARARSTWLVPAPPRDRADLERLDGREDAEAYVRYMEEVAAPTRSGRRGTAASPSSTARTATARSS